MPYADPTELPEDVRDAYSESCQWVFVNAFNDAEGEEDDRMAAAHAAAQRCEANNAEEAGAEPDCGCDHVKSAVGRKVLPLEEADVSVEDAGTGTFSGYANVFGIVDDGGDKVVKGAFKPTLESFVKDGFIAWGHDWLQPIATVDSAVEDDHGLLITATFHSTPEAQRARQLTAERLKRGKSMGLSIGYEVGDSKDTSYGRDITSFKRLFETSLVTVPMNRPSTVTAIKGSLGSGKPYAERLALALAQAEAIERELKWLATHSRQRADLRLKDGRVLSAANRERLSTLKSSLSAVLRDLEELLRATDPDRDKAAAQAALVRSFQTLSGVTD